MSRETVIVIDFGGQYNQLVARRVRECNVYCEIYSYKTDIEKIKEMNPKGYPMILTGDFNTEPHEQVILGELDTLMNSARKTAVATDNGDTFNGWGKGKGVIDHIYWSGFSTCTSFEVIRKPYMDRKFISDHYPVKACLVF